MMPMPTVRADDVEAAGREFDVRFLAASSASAARPRPFLDNQARRLVDGRAAIHHGARPARAAACEQLVAVALEQPDLVERHAKPVGQHLGEGRGVALAVIQCPRRDRDAAIRIEADTAHLFVCRRRDLQIMADADATALAACGGSRPCGLAKSVPIRSRQGLVEQGRESRRNRRSWSSAPRRASGLAECGCAGATRPGRSPSHARPCRPGAPCSSCPPAARPHDRRRRAGVGEDIDAGDLHQRGPIDADHVLHGVHRGRDRRRIAQIGADIAVTGQADRQEMPFRSQRKLSREIVVTAMAVGQEAVGPRIRPFHRAAQHRVSPAGRRCIPGRLPPSCRTTRRHCPSAPGPAPSGGP